MCARDGALSPQGACGLSGEVLLLPTCCEAVQGCCRRDGAFLNLLSGFEMTSGCSETIAGPAPAEAFSRIVWGFWGALPDLLGSRLCADSPALLGSRLCANFPGLLRSHP